MHTPVPVSSGPTDQATAPSFGILSTFPPTSCGIATFSAALAAGLIGEGASVDVVRCGPSPDVEDVLVVGSLADSTDVDHRRAVDALNRNDLVIVQHEYGLYDGADGESIIDLVDSIDAPVVLVAHTVLTDPTENQRRILERVCRSADAVVVMTKTAHARLLSGYDVDGSKVHVIPHGAATPLAAPSASQRRPGTPPRLLTWGLLGPGKGIEWAIDAMAELDGLDPLPEYVIAGATHPKVREQHGETYRRMLVDRAASSIVDVTFDDTYRDLMSLTDLIQSADLVVLPYDSREQVTSGVLVDAVAAGRPVVSTAFPHAVELLGERRRHRGPPTRPRGARACDPLGAHRSVARSVDGGRGPTARSRAGLVGGRAALRRARRPDRGRAPAGAVMTLPSFAHVLSMSDGIGMFEHADHTEPRRAEGYCTDDVARLLIVAVREPARSQAVRDLARTAFRFLAESQNVHGQIRNRRDARGRWHGRHGVEDCWGRSLWAFGTAARRAPEEWMRASAISYFDHGSSERSPHRRAMAFAALGAAEVAHYDRRHRRSRELLADAITVDRVTIDGRRLAVARTASVVRERGAPRGTDRRGRRAGSPRRPRGRPGAAAVAARSRNRRRPPLADAGRWGRTAATTPADSISSRSRSLRSPMRAIEPTPSPATTSGGVVSTWRSDGSPATTTSTW